MRNDQIFVLMLVILLPMSGCFDGGGVGEAEGAQDSDEASGGTTVVNHYYNNTTTSSNAQERIWYSTGDTFESTWNDGLGVASSSERCMEYGPHYDSSTGEYLGEECKRYGFPNKESDWNVTNCTNVGGTPVWSNLATYENNDDDNDPLTNYAYAWAPSCTDITMFSIQTQPGEALLLYQKFGTGTWTTTCDGVSTSLTYYGLPGGAYGNEYLVVQGSSMLCTHEMVRSMNFNHESTTMDMWSIVYAIQDVTIV